MGLQPGCVGLQPGYAGLQPGCKGAAGRGAHVDPLLVDLGGGELELVVHLPPPRLPHGGAVLREQLDVAQHVEAAVGVVVLATHLGGEMGR